MHPIPPNVGAALRRLRQERGLSLDDAAQITGVSKAMLGQVERGESSPTVSTLWKISSGLRVSLSALITPPSVTYTLISLDEIKPVSEANGQILLYDIFPFDPATGFEVFTLIVKPGCVYTSPSHPNVVEEFVIVTDGVLTLTVEGQVVVVQKGMAIKFNGSAQHTYANSADKDAIFQNIIRY